MKNALSDLPVWLQILGAVDVVLAVGVLAGSAWALLVAGLLVLVVGVMLEQERLDTPAKPPRGATRADRAGAES